MSIDNQVGASGEEGAKAVPAREDSTSANTDVGDPAIQRVAYNVSETATMLGVCEKTVRRLIARGVLRPNRALRHHLISKKEIERFLEESL